LEACGRTHNLRHSYRTTREILQLATLLYRLRLTDEKDGDILVPDLLNMPSGAFPEIIPMTSPQDEIARLANEVASLVKQGIPNSDKPKPKRFKHEGHKGHEGRPLIKLYVLRVLCV
jgi:hypothetical protein